jgi:hypothetical protein
MYNLDLDNTVLKQGVQAATECNEITSTIRIITSARQIKVIQYNVAQSDKICIYD